LRVFVAADTPSAAGASSNDATDLCRYRGQAVKVVRIGVPIACAKTNSASNHSKSPKRVNNYLLELELEQV
jgi:hypothetical protein